MRRSALALLVALIGFACEAEPTADPEPTDANMPDAADQAVAPDAALPDAGPPTSDCVDEPCGAWNSPYDADGALRPTCHTRTDCPRDQICQTPGIALEGSTDQGGCQHTGDRVDPGYCVERALFETSCALPDACVPPDSPCAGADFHCANRQCPTVTCGPLTQRVCTASFGDPFEADVVELRPEGCLARLADGEPQTQITLVTGFGDTEEARHILFVAPGLAMVTLSDNHGALGNNGQYGPVRVDPEAVAECVEGIEGGELVEYAAVGCLMQALTLCPADLALPPVSNRPEAMPPL